jgi:hypothetical protein
MGLSITILQPANLTATVDGGSILAAVVGASATLNVDMGVPGPGATVQVGTTTTGAPGTNADVVNVGTLSAAILDFTIPRGDAGDSATVDAGTTITLEAGSDATVENVGTTSNAIFNFGIPAGVRGEQGERGYQGDKGDQGNAATITVYGTNTLPPNEPANVENFGTPQAASFYFSIPQGIQGEQGERGQKGDTGDTGAGVATGGTTGQALVKSSNADYSTNWAGPFLSKVDAGIQGIAGSIQVQGLDLNENSITNVGTATLNQLNVTLGSSPKIHFGNGDQTTAWIDAPTDNSIYGRKNGSWSTIPSSAGGGTWGSITGTLSNQTDLQNALNGKLSLAGGTMAAGALIDFSADTNSNTSELGAWGLGIDNANAGETAYIQSNQIRIYNGDFVNGTSLTPNGINFNDETTQTTAYDPAVLGNYLPLTGGTLADNSGINFNDAENNNTTVINGQGVVATDGSGSQCFINGLNVGSVSSDGSVSMYFSYATGLHFPNSTIQTTAFPPTGGTTSQYITGTGSLVTFPPLGDRYFTTSNSTLTCDSGNGKTMTVETGLSYSRQQDITVSYNNANHMHGTVLTYDSATGVMTFDSNTHSGSGTYSNWEVNVGGVAGAVLPVGGTASQVLAKVNSTNFNTEWISLGSMANETATDYLAKAGNLSGLASTSTARTNLGLGTMAVATATDYLTKAGNLSGLASTSTARTNLGLGAVSTDAYATTAQAQAGTSTTTVINPSTLLDAKWFAGGKSMVQIAWATSVSGAGASAGAQNSNARINIAPTTATGYAISSAVIANNSRGTIFNSGFDFSKRVAFGLRVARNVASPDTASVWRFSIGKSSGTDASDISARGLQVKVAGSGALQLLVHNGTTLTTTTSSYTPANGVSYDIVVTSDGAGNCVLYVNGSSVATSTGGPTTAGTTNANTMMFEVQNTSVITGSPQNIAYSDYFVQVNS